MAPILFLAVNLLSLADNQAQSKFELKAQRPAWDKVASSLAVLKDSHGAGTGFAVLVQDSGMFIANRSAVQARTVNATLSGPQAIELVVVGEDATTQLVSLQAKNWRTGMRLPVRVVDREIGPDEVLLAASSSGPVVGQFANSRRPGVSGRNQFLPLYEIRLESTMDLLGGAVVFSQSGELVGILSATQGPADRALTGTFGSPGGFGGGGGGAAKPAAPGKGTPTAADLTQKNLSNYGPQGLTVGYVLGPRVLKRAINGFASSDHKVKHPYIGVEFREPVKGRVALTLVKAGSPALQAGLKGGDTVLKVGTTSVQSSVHFASLLFEQEPGETMRLTIERQGVVQTVDVAVGVQPDGR
ncbi:MAG: PDZ domain-containing protein [Armatimonadetes bacterium]|nr:PDZ domain-containing protein [Armatimonadota bacterium]